MRMTLNVTLTALVLLSFCFTTEVQAGLINHWKFDGTGDDTGSSDMDVTLLNGATYAAGQFGQALSLDGVNDYANRAASAPLTSDGNFTISLWANQLDASPVQQRYLGWGASGARAFMGPYSAGTGAITMGIGSTTITFSNASSIPQQNTWQNWTFVRSGTSASLYLDGTLIQTLTSGISGSVNATAELHIGRQYGSFGEYFHGLLDDVAIWDEALELEQIQNIANFGAQYFDGAPPVPEPSSILLIGLGALGLVRHTRRRGRKA